MSIAIPKGEPPSYNYAHFDLAHRTLDRLDGPEVGQPAPDFEAERLADGARVWLSDFQGRIVVLETGSVTCPMYVGRIEPMAGLVDRFREAVFLVLYTREAHPGEHIGRHRDIEEKKHAARLLVAEEHERRTLLVDDLAGTAHRAYGAMPNMIYILDRDGRVAFRGLWNDPPVVEQALRQVIDGREAVSPPPGFPTTPSPEGVRERVLRRAGHQAMEDLTRAFPERAAGTGPEPATTP